MNIYSIKSEIKITNTNNLEDQINEISKINPKVMSSFIQYSKSLNDKDIDLATINSNYIVNVFVMTPEFSHFSLEVKRFLDAKQREVFNG